MQWKILKMQQEQNTREIVIQKVSKRNVFFSFAVENKSKGTE
jgi:hypothetical protein